MQVKCQIHDRASFSAILHQSKEIEQTPPASIRAGTGGLDIGVSNEVDTPVYRNPDSPAGRHISTIYIRSPNVIFGDLSRPDILNGIRQGFMRTPTEILLFFVILTSLLLILVVYAVIRAVIARLRTSRRSREIFIHLLARLDLSGEERAIFLRLVSYMSPSHQDQDLLLKRRVFDACAEKMRAAEGTPKALLASLRMKVGFNVLQPYETPASSEDLPTGMVLLLVQDEGTRLRGTITAQAPKRMFITLDPGSRPPAIGRAYAVYFNTPSGVFRFHSRSVDAADGTVSLEHSKTIEHFQRRAFFRVHESLPVYIKVSLSAGAPVEATLLDISSGGAGLRNPGIQARQGDLLEMSFSPVLKRLPITARIIRTSKDGKLLFVRFESLSRMDRKRLAGFILAEPA